MVLDRTGSSTISTSTTEAFTVTGPFTAPRVCHELSANSCGRQRDSNSNLMLKCKASEKSLC